MIKFCQKCKNDNVTQYCCVGGYYWIFLESVNTCMVCGSRFENIDFPAKDFKVLYNISKDSSFIEGMMALKKKDIIEYETKMSQFRNQVETQKSDETQNSNQVKCLKCGSTNIQIVPRKWSLLTGFMTNKTDRVCVNCKHKF